MSVFGNRKVAAAVRTKEDFEIALLSRVDVIFLLYSSILTMKAYVEKCHKAGKIIFIHMDFAEGIGKGLVEFPWEVDDAISAGAAAVSTADRDLWDYR